MVCAAITEGHLSGVVGVKFTTVEGTASKTTLCNFSSVQQNNLNESTTGADASVEALKLYHMKLTLAYSTCSASDSSLPEYKKWEMIVVIVAKKSSKSTNGL